MTSHEEDELKCLGLQIAELEGLECAYTLNLVEQEKTALRTAHCLCQGEIPDECNVSHPGENGALSELSGSFQIPDIQVAGSPISLQYQLPRLYPLHAAAKLSVDTCAPWHAHNAMTQAVVNCAEQELGGCCLFLAAQELKDAALRLLDSGLVGSEDQATQQRQQSALEASASTAARPRVLTRRVCCLWFHHIKSLNKRKVIVGWAEELRLGGASKPGYPGVLLVEGAAEDVQEYVARLRSLQWKAMQVRAEQDDDWGLEYQLGNGARGAEQSCMKPKKGRPGSENESNKGEQKKRQEPWRRLPLPLVELPENALGELGTMCKVANLTHIFASALKLPCAS